MLGIHLSADLRERFDAALAKTGRCRLPALSFSATAYLALELRAAFGRTVVAVADTPRTLDELGRALQALAGTRPERVERFPAWDALPGRASAAPRRDAEPERAGERLDALARLAARREPVVLATCVQALMQRTLVPAALAGHLVELAVGRELEIEALAARLERLGYAFEADVQEPGQAARRGGLLDVWPPTAEHPLRIEFDGNTVETLRAFDPGTQRSFARLAEARLLPASEWRLLRQQPDSGGLLTDHVPAAPLFLWAAPLAGACAPFSRAPAGLLAHAAAYQEALDEAGGSDLTVPFSAVLDAAGRIPGAWHCLPDSALEDPAAPGAQAGSALLADAEAPRLDPGFRTLADLGAPRRELLAPDVFAEQRRLWLERLAGQARAGWRVHLFFYTQGALERFREICPEPAFHRHVGLLPDGFLQASLRLVVLAESSLLGRPKLLPEAARRPGRTVRAAAASGETITDWTRLEPGDFVVHVEHGIGRYLGLREIEFHGQRQEVLAVEYAGNAKLYVPASHAHLLSRYVGVGAREPPLHRLGGTRWSREKDAAERAVQDLAAVLLETQARRESTPGFAFPPDTPWQHEFEASFPYQETEDQERAIRDAKRDMESPRPMDRLVCGDVGYGKTEVALRAAFKCVMSGRQAALLAPTTVLAQQHFEVFADRLAAYPVRVELLCRFRTAAEQEAVVRGLASGAVDIVIGTHRLIQPDVRFRQLGLVIVDEEQRFGVAHKERFKRLDQLVDVLTLTATPIPRTLYLSLTGAREISVIQTPPRARLPIETLAARNDDRVIREAVLRELNRGGQVYYLHNRVQTIERVRARLAQLVPEARVVVAHGQMPAGDLASAMRAFAGGAGDVLLCTTIIESGLDIPNVNTILIDRADRFGMADLYQLRGRVGRSSRQAYAILLMPVHGRLLDGSRRRLQAILEHSDLGAGFRLALRDLEIRGAGNLLGAAQSGHIAAIGFELYCQLLRQTIARLKAGAAGAPPAAPAASARAARVDVVLDFIDLSSTAPDPARAALLPAGYVEDERLRLGVYRQIAGAATAAELDALRGEFKDRFGPVPAPLARLLTIAALRLAAAEKGVSSVEVADGKIMLTRRGEPVQEGHRFPRLRAARPDARLEELLDHLRRLPGG